MRIRYVLLNAYAMGGTTRTVVNQANALCDEHDIEIASVYRHRRKPRFDIDPRVRVLALSDLRSDGTRRTDPARPRLLNRLRRLTNPLPHRHDYRFRHWDPEVDLRVVRYLRRADDGIVVTTRPGLNLLNAWFAPRRLVRVAQDHMNLAAYRPALREAIVKAYPRLDAVTVLTDHDLAVYGRALEGTGARLERIPNGIPKPALPPAALDAKVLIAAGRLTRQKGFDLLLEAFREVTAKHPDWQLWIFGGGGNQRDALAGQLERLGLAGKAHLKGGTDHLDQMLAAASIYVLSSRYEGLPMVLLEAMAAGLPVVSFDCPTGPAEILTHGQNGLLVTPEKTAALAAGICELIEDPQRRRRMGAAARAAADRYSVDEVRGRWEHLFADLCAARAGGVARGAGRPGTAQGAGNDG